MTEYLTYAAAAKWLSERGLPATKSTIKYWVLSGKLSVHRPSYKTALVPLVDLERLLGK